MKTINYILLLVFNFTFSQVKLINNDTINTKFYHYNNHIVKSFVYKKQFITTQTGEQLFVLLDSICNNESIKQKVVYTETAFNKFYYYKDSLIIRNWNLRNTPKQNSDYFQLNVYLKSRKYKNLSISLEYNKNDSLCRRIVIFKPDSLTFYTSEIYADVQFNDTKLNSPLSFKIDDTTYLQLYFNNRNFLDKIYYSSDDQKALHVKFANFFIPIEYGFRDIENQSREGIWYSYFKNGKLFSEGEYLSTEVDHNGIEKNIKKKGKWIYYTEQGCIDKEELWKEGINISPKLKNKSKK